MSFAAETIANMDGSDLEKRVSEAVRDQAAPISKLLRLFWALDATKGAANQNDVLREQLRARIGAPFPS